MDVLDRTDGHFLYQHFPDDRRYAGLGVGIPDHRTPGFSDDSDHAGYAILFGVVRQRLYPSGVARIDGFGVMVCDDHIFGLGNCGDAVGMILIEE